MEADAGLDARGVDAHVGSVIRMRRKTKGISQQRLAATLGVSFQQVQKYERGANRVAASTLLQLAEALGCEVADFYVGLPSRAGSEKRGDPDGYGSIGRQFLSAEEDWNSPGPMSHCRRIGAGRFSPSPGPCSVGPLRSTSGGGCCPEMPRPGVAWDALRWKVAPSPPTRSDSCGRRSASVALQELKGGRLGRPSSPLPPGVGVRERDNS